MSDWRDATLGDLFTVDNTKLRVHSVEPTVMSLSKYDGFVRADDYFDKRIASKSLDTYKVVEPNEWAFSTIHIDEGSIARNNLGERGVISPMYTTMRWVSESDLPEYAELLVRDPSMLAEYKARAQGSINRRRSLPFKAFGAIPVLLPPKAEQRRIVRIVRAVDEVIAATSAEELRLNRLLGALSADRLNTLGGAARLGSLMKAGSGPSYGAADVSSEPGEGRTPVIGIPNTKPDGTLNLAQVSHVSGLPKSVRTVNKSSLILVRTNGNRARIGNVYLPGVEAHDHAVSAFQFLMDVHDPADREFVFWTLREPGMQSRMSSAASGTTGLGNLAVKWLNAAEIPWSEDRAERDRVVADLRAVKASLDALTEELARLKAMRAGLVAALLLQDVTADHSVDRFIETDSEVVA